MYWSVFEAAVFYGVSERTIRRAVSRGVLEHVRIGSAIRIPKERPGFTPLRQRLEVEQSA
jgi:excisionase family DNA binding protein